jgi:serine/threonine-protein kinase
MVANNNENKDEESIFNAAIELDSPAERTAYLRKACGKDQDLLNRVQALLELNEIEDGFLEEPPTLCDVPTGSQVQTEAPGTVIGRYKLLDKIGEGGFGAVWAAEQKKPVKRRVALKIIKLGMDTKQVVARFEAERQALALMDHPNIAKVLDVGSTETGRPYFVMELVRGIPITSYCDQAKLSTHDRLNLFIKVCNAVQHAHQKGIIHRDIKPSNILITLHDGVPVPRIIDFGIAKAMQQELTEMTI